MKRGKEKKRKKSAQLCNELMNQTLVIVSKKVNRKILILNCGSCSFSLREAREKFSLKNVVPLKEIAVSITLDSQQTSTLISASMVPVGKREDI